MQIRKHILRFQDYSFGQNGYLEITTPCLHHKHRLSKKMHILGLICTSNTYIYTYLDPVNDICQGGLTSRPIIFIILNDLSDLDIHQGCSKGDDVFFMRNTRQFQMMIWQHNSLTQHAHTYQGKVEGLYCTKPQSEFWDLCKYFFNHGMKIHIFYFYFLLFFKI